MRWVWLQALVISLLGLISRTSDSSVPPNCDPEYPFMSAGDFNITKENFQPMLKKHEFVLMAITSSKDCDLCCPYEKTISQIRERNFQNKTSLFYDYKIKMGRLDLAKEGWFSSLHPNFRVLPSWVMYVRGEPFYIQNYHIINRLLNGIARVVEPYEFIQSMAAFERFMNHTKTDVSGRHLVRNKVVALFSEPDEYEEELDNFKRTALKSYWREETLFALITKKEVVNEIYRKHGPKYLPNQYDKNSIFYLKLKNRFAKKEELKLVDFSKIGDLPAWLAKSSISPLEEMTNLNQFAFSTKAPLLVAFVDPQREIQTQAFLDQLEYLGTKYLNRVNFVWVDYRDNLQLMKRLGVEGFSLPCIGLESPHGSNEAFVLNKTNPHHKEIDQFLEDYFAKRLKGNQNLIVKVGMHKAKEEQDKVMFTKGLDVMDFYGLLHDDNADALVYFYNSSTSISQSQDHRSEVVNFLAKFVPENLKLFTLRICSYDLGRFRMPEDMFNDRRFEMNSVYLIPASQSKGPFLKFQVASDAEFTADKLLRFALAHVDFKYEPNPDGITMTPEEEKMFGNSNLFEEITDEEPNQNAEQTQEPENEDL